MVCALIFNSIVILAGGALWKCCHQDIATYVKLLHARNACNKIRAEFLCVVNVMIMKLEKVSFNLKQLINGCLNITIINQIMQNGKMNWRTWNEIGVNTME